MGVTGVHANSVVESSPHNRTLRHESPSTTTRVHSGPYVSSAIQPPRSDNHSIPITELGPIRSIDSQSIHVEQLHFD